MRARLRAVIQWLWFNLLCFLPFFLLTGLLVRLFPQTMLRVFGQWAVLMEAVGARGAGDFASQADMFRHVLTANSITAAIYFALGLVLQSPLVMLFTGLFYGSVAFLAPFTVGRPFGFHDWALTGVELGTLALSISLSSALAGDLFGVQAHVRSLWHYWKQNWNRLLPRPVENWRSVLRAWFGALVLVGCTIALLLCFVAWFETYGY